MALPCHGSTSPILTRSTGPVSMPITSCTNGCPRNEYYEFKPAPRRPTDLGCLMGEPGLQGHSGSRRLQHPLMERQRLLPARGLCLRELHRAPFRGPWPSLRRNAQNRRHPHRPALGHAQGMVCRPRRAVEVRHAKTGAGECGGGPHGGDADDQKDEVEVKGRRMAFELPGCSWLSSCLGWKRKP